MSVEDLVDDYWRETLTANLNGPQAQAKYNDFIYGLRDRVAKFPQEAQDEVFLRAAKHNAGRIAQARVSLNFLREKLGVPVVDNRLADVAVETLVRATVWQGVSAFFRLFR
jgi:hypothetical protein